MFHIVFGKTVPDISLNAVANLGYAACRFLAPVYPGDTLSSASEVIGLKENSNRQTGVVYVRSRGFNQHGDDRARLRALGDGAQARPERAVRGGTGPGTAEGDAGGFARRRLPGNLGEALRFRARRREASLRRLSRRARKSTTSTA